MQHLQSAIVGLVDHFGYVGLFIGMALGNIGAPIGSEIVLPAAGALTATGHLPALWATILVSIAGELAGGTVGYAIGRFGYVGLFIGMALGNIGAPIGSEIVLPAAGALTATGHLPALWATILVSIAGELAGGTVGYAIGRFGGRPLIDKYGRFVHLTHENLDRVHAFFERYGSFAIFICRFVPVIRGIVSIPAGIAEMNLAHFYLWYALGSAVFCGGLILVGNALGDHLDAIAPVLHKSGLAILGLAIVVIAVVAIMAARRNRARAT